MIAKPPHYSTIAARASKSIYFRILGKVLFVYLVRTLLVLSDTITIFSPPLFSTSTSLPVIKEHEGETESKSYNTTRSPHSVTEARQSQSYSNITLGPQTADSPLKQYCADCLEPAPIDGQWEYQDNVKHLANICCGWYKSKRRTNPPECGSKIVKNPLIYHIVNESRPMAMGGKGCERTNFHDQYVWKSDRLDDFDPALACKLLGNRTVYMFGDSTMVQAAATLTNALLHHPSSISCRTQFTQVAADTLINQKFGKMSRGYHFADIVERDVPDMVILSAGAHIYKSNALPNEEAFKHVVNEVISNITQINQKHPHIKFIWKTLSQGGCTEKISALPPDETARTVKFHQYNYDAFYGRDLYAISRFCEHGIPIMDMRMLYSRSDAHVSNNNCVHWSSPGPLDVVPLVFQNLLQYEL